MWACFVATSSSSCRATGLAFAHSRGEGAGALERLWCGWHADILYGGDTEQAKKCEKEEKSEKGKVKKAIEKGNIEGARIYAQNAIRKKTEQLNYLKVRHPAPPSVAHDSRD